MKNRLILSSAALLLIGAASCTDEIIVQETKETGVPIELTFKASNGEFDGNVSTRTLVREGYGIYWTANDRISLFDGKENNPFITKDGGLVANFRGTVTQSSDWYFALYPYNKDAKFDYDNYVFSTVLYSEQYTEPDSYASGMNLAVARSMEDDAQDLGFYNSASYLRVI
ncbi:MAG TPA: hypothetical protein H9778_06700, partial [Candidatus Parabacteroides intestinavium]|nr:hypothetical protein [Candidatus Parabacteroides intestinavium]